jgi:membrane protein required for colicin V production
MTAFDYGVLIIVGMSVLFSVVRGLVRELLSLAAWIVAVVAAGSFGSRLAERLPLEIPTQELRFIAGCVIVFLVVLVLMNIAAVAVSRLVRSAGLAFEDSFLGAFFGVARGLLVVILLVLLAGLTSLPQEKVWRQAMLSAPLEAVSLQVKEWLPEDVSRRIRYN